jgi:hypothetical protein
LSELDDEDKQGLRDYFSDNNFEDQPSLEQIFKNRNTNTYRVLKSTERLKHEYEKEHIGFKNTKL